MNGTTVTRERWIWLTGLVAAVVTIVVLVLVVDGGGRTHPAAAATAPGTDVVTVSGVGTVQGVPDTLTATFDVHVTRPTVQTALDAEAGAARRVLAALSRHGVSGRSVQTASLQLSPHYDNSGHVSGYDAVETVTGRISPVGTAGATISAAASASGNEASVDGLSFDVADDHALLADARGKAFDDAKARAQQYAALTGRGLGAVAKVSEVVETASPPQPQQFGDALAAPAAAKAVAIRPGEQPVTVTVTVTWRLS